MPYREPVTLTCECGAEFVTRCCTRKLCDDCVRKHKLEYQRQYVAEWWKRNKGKKAEYQRDYRAKRTPHKNKEGAYPAKEFPCIGGCGRMVLTRSRNGHAYCPECREKAKAANLAKFVAEHGCTPQAAWAREHREAGREASRRYYERNKERLKAERDAKKKPPREKMAVVKLEREIQPPMPKAAKTASAPKATPKPKAPPKAKAVAATKPQAPKLPTEAQKLAMLRAAMRKYYGD